MQIHLAVGDGGRSEWGGVGSEFVGWGLSEQGAVGVSTVGSEIKTVGWGLSDQGVSE